MIANVGGEYDIGAAVTKGSSFMRFDSTGPTLGGLAVGLSLQFGVINGMDNFLGTAEVLNIGLGRIGISVFRNPQLTGGLLSTITGFSVGPAVPADFGVMASTMSTRVLGAVAPHPGCR